MIHLTLKKSMKPWVTTRMMFRQDLCGSKPSLSSSDASIWFRKCKLSRMECCLKDTEECYTTTDVHDVALLEQNQGKVNDMKRQLSALYEEIVVLDLSEDHDLDTDHTVLEMLPFKCAHKLKKLLNQ